METRPPTVTRILIAVGFAISCFALALFLWLAFGGTIPLKPEGYRFTVPVTEATQLAVESDVRISGVSVGHVKSLELGSDGRADATIEMDSAYAPIPDDTRAILRQKTLLGETYVELTPGSDSAPTLPEGGRLPPAQVAESVQLDEIFRAFDPRTRAAFQAWMQGQSASLRGRGEDFSIALASLPSFADDADRLLRLLDSQDVALRDFIRNGAQTFNAFSERSGQLSGTIQNAAKVFATTADRNAELQEIFRIFPTFLRESRETLTRLETFARDTDPVAVGLQPAAHELTPTLTAVQQLAPQLDSFFVGLGKADQVGPPGLKATTALLRNDLPPLLEGFDPWLAEFNPILEALGRYKRELATAPANLAAASNGVFFDPALGKSFHYLRTEAPLMPEALATYPHRLQISRSNPYFKPGGFANLKAGLESFEIRQCSMGVNAFLDPSSPSNPAFQERAHGDAAEAQLFFDRIVKFAFAGQQNTQALTGPPCKQQGPVQSIGENQDQSEFLHVRKDP